MRNLKTTICFLGLLIAGSAGAAVHYVPTDYPTIQAAIDAASGGDSIVINPGTYSGPGNYSISFKGKAITVQSTDPGDPYVVNTTVIDCQGSPSTRGFVFHSGETSDSKLTGLTITGGDNFLGGGIYCYNSSSPAISKCVITANSAVFGGAVAVGNNNSQPTISACTITENSAMVGGGAIYCIGSGPRFESCIIAGNFAPRGGAVYSHNPGNSIIANCTITSNAASVWGGAFYCFASGNMDISNCILWDNTASSASEMMVGNVGAPASVSISYCDIQGLSAGVVANSGSTVNWGQGNIDLDPMFVSGGQMDSITKVYTKGNYHLTEDSPCIDAGNPSFVAGTQIDIDGESRLSGAAVDIGADEFAVVSTINADIKFRPRALNLRSRGRWTLCTIKLDDGHDVRDIAVDSIKLNNEVKPSAAKAFRFSKKLFVMFNRAEVENTLSDAQGSALIVVTGNLGDGTVFEGQDTIKIVNGYCNMKNKTFGKLSKHFKQKCGKICKK
ncbi:MAG TPA: hypothetical protein HPP87_00250 [Planctomycetes bacterium]|nr:hypothetical protein [Planctomycetota bacterium]